MVTNSKRKFMNVEKVLKALFQKDKTDSGSYSSSYENMKVTVIFLSTLIIMKNQEANMFITVSVPKLTYKRMMRSMQVQMPKNFLLQLIHKPIQTCQFNMVNQYMCMV